MLLLAMHWAESRSEVCYLENYCICYPGSAIWRACFVFWSVSGHKLAIV